MLLRVVGWLLMVLAGIMLLPCLCGIIYGEHSAISFLICIGITLACSFSLMAIKPKSKEMGKREAILLTGLTWVILSLFGMLPFILCGTHLNVTDAFFETMSGFTTTGATVLDSLSGVSHSILLWRCLLQWIGGLGIILFTLAVVPMLNYQGGMQLFNAEVTGITHDKLQPRVSYTAKGLWLVYLVLTILLLIFLSFSEMDFFDAVCYSLSTMSTGGFSNSDMSLADWNSVYIKTILIIFMFFGGVNFAMIFNAARGNYKIVLKNTTLKVYLWIIFISYLLLLLNLIINGLIKDVEDATVDPLFQAVSILTSTGLTEPDFQNWGPLATLVLIILMIMGGCAGSTSGGAKIDRFIVLFKFLKNEFYKMMHPNAVTTVSMNGKGTSNAILNKTLAFLFLYLLVIIVGACVMILLGMNLKDSFFCVLASISNMGLGTDTTGINGNYANVIPAAKWILSFIMLVGRLELYTVLLIFTPLFWKK